MDILNRICYKDKINSGKNFSSPDIRTPYWPALFHFHNFCLQDIAQYLFHIHSRQFLREHVSVFRLFSLRPLLYRDDLNTTRISKLLSIVGLPHSNNNISLDIEIFYKSNLKCLLYVLLIAHLISV